MQYYDELLAKCNALGKVEIIGKTHLEFGIPLVHMGEGKASTLIVASVHAREHITTDLVFELLSKERHAVDCIPALNIDGVMMCLYGVEWIENVALKKYLYGINGGSKDFSLWKANAHSVDINVNFDAGWGTGASNVRYPSNANYIGKAPESEPETKAAANILRKGKYAQVVCFHSKGEVIYWGYGDNYLHYAEAESYAKFLGYELTTAKSSAGGLKDYYDKISRGLGLTVEIGEDKFPHPYPKSELNNLVKKHEGSIKLLYDNGKRIAEKIYGGGD